MHIFTKFRNSLVQINKSAGEASNTIIFVTTLFGQKIGSSVEMSENFKFKIYYLRDNSAKHDFQTYLDNFSNIYTGIFVQAKSTEQLYFNNVRIRT